MLVSCTVNGKTRQLENDGGLHFHTCQFAYGIKMHAVVDRSSWTFAPAQAFAAWYQRDLRVNRSFRRLLDCLQDEVNAVADLFHAHLHAGMRVAFCANWNLHRELVIGCIGMVATQIARNAGGSLNRTGSPLVECSFLWQMAGRN